MLQDNSIAEVPAGAVSEVGLTLTSLKILNKLVVYAWGGAGLTSQEQKAAVEQSQSDFYRSTLDDFVKLLHLRTAACDRGALSHLSPESRFVDLLNRLVTRYVRFSRGLLLNNYLTFHRIGVTQQLTQVCWQCVEDAAKDLSTNMTGAYCFVSLSRVTKQGFTRRCTMSIPREIRRQMPAPCSQLLFGEPGL